MSNFFDGVNPGTPGSPHQAGASSGQNFFDTINPQTPGEPGASHGSNQGPVAPSTDSGFVAALKGAGAGFGQTVLSGQELLGEGMKAIDLPGGDWLTNDARTGLANLQHAIAGDEAAHPWLTKAGEIGGSMAIPAEAGALSGASRYGLAALEGATAGILSPGNPNDYWRSKAVEAGLGGGAGVAGSAAMNTLGGAIAPRFKTAVTTLMNEGVHMTPGQLAGGAAKATEDKLASIPVAGDMVRAAQRRSIDDFNVAAYNRVLAPIGERFQGDAPGYDGIKALQKQISSAYDRALNGVQFQADQQFATDLFDISRLSQELPPDKAKQFTAILRNRLLHRMPNGTMSGDVFKQVESELTNKTNQFYGSPDLSDRQLAELLQQTNASFREALERSNPGKRATLAATNRAWAMFSRVRRAAANRTTSGGVFTPSDLLSAAKYGDRSVGKGAFARGDALMQDFGLAGQEVLPNTYPDSGTAGRLLMGRMLFPGGLTAAAGYANPMAAAGVLGGIAPYTKFGSRVGNWLARTASSPGPARQAMSTLVRQAGTALAPATGGSAAGLVQQP